MKKHLYILSVFYFCLPGLSFSQFTVYNSAITTSIESGLTVTIQGGFTNDRIAPTNGVLDIQGTGVLQVSGNWTNNATNAVFTAASGTVLLNGTTAAQTVGGIQATDFNNLTLNNTFGTSPQFNITRDENVLGTLTMTSGNISISSSYILTIGSSAAAPGALSHTSGWAYGGTFRRYFNTPSFAIGNSAGHFPVGSSNDYRPFWLAYSGALTTGGTASLSHTGVYPAWHYIVNFLDASWGNTVLYTSQSYWTLSTSGIAVGASPFEIRMEATGLGTVADVNHLGISLAGSAIGTYAASAGTTTNPQVNRTGLTTAQLANDFYYSSINEASPLPIELLTFDAELKNNNVYLSWMTASEINNDYFTIERSGDGLNFEPLLQIQGAGNSTTAKNYHAVDELPFSGISYYRLLQTDYDGKTTRSETVIINNESLIAPYFNVFTDPADGNKILVSMKGIDNPEVLVVVTDMLGKETFSKVVVTEDGQVLTAIDPYQKLSPGIYLITATSGNDLFKQKIVVR